MAESKRDLVELTATVVSAYVGANTIGQQELPALIRSVHGALSDLSNAQSQTPGAPPEPAVSLKRSITPDHLICLEDGKKFKSLKRHLRTRYGMSPDEYRAKWNLPADYPMVAPNYAKERSNLAKRMGLGHAKQIGNKS
jgi:predicted transcriptional regulator